MPTLKLALLGSPQIELDHQRVALKPRKAFALLVYLAVTGEAQTRDHLAALFWPEASQQEARAALRRRLSELNGALGEGWLEIERESVRLSTRPDLWLDTAKYREWCSQVQVHGHVASELCAACRESLTQAVALYRGDFLIGFTLPDCPGFDEWHFFQAESLRQTQAGALERLVQWHSSYGDAAAAILHARAQVALDPLHEPAHRQLMQLYHRAGQRAAALRQYEECQRLLAAELGVLPDEKTQALYAQLKLNVSNVVPASTSPLPLPTPPALAPLETVDGAPSMRFVGRSRELQALTQALAHAQAGQGQVRFVIGEAGSGKTMLVQEFVRRAQATHPQLLAIVGHCNAYTGGGEPYLPFREALAWLAGEGDAQSTGGWSRAPQSRRLEAALPTTIPALIEHGPELLGAFVAAQRLRVRAAAFASPQTSWFQQLSALAAREQSVVLEERRIFSQYVAVLKAIAKHYPLLLVLEDLHWVDLSSSALLFHFSRTIGDSRILIIGTYRPTEVAFGPGVERHPMADMVAEFKRQHGPIWLDMGGLSSSEGRDFVNAYIDTEPNQLDGNFRTALFHHTAGNALFTVELLRSMQTRGDLQRNENGLWSIVRELDWSTLPAKVEGVIERQLARLTDEDQAILRVACVQGENFTAEIVARILQLDIPMLVQKLSQQLGRQQRLVSALELRWLDGQRLSQYRFRHYLFQYYLYQSLDETERIYLHEAVGNALESIYGEESSEIAVQLAYHFQQAGLVEKAVDALLLAAKHAQQVAAFRGAIHHLTAGLALLEKLPANEARLHHELDFLTLLAAAMQSAGDYELTEVEAVYSRARTLCQQSGEREKLWPILYGLFDVHFHRGHYLQAYRVAQEQLAMSQDESTSEPHLIAAWMMAEVSLALGDFAPAVDYANRMIELYDPLKHQSLRYRYVNLDLRLEGLATGCATKSFAGYFDQARRDGEEMLAIASESGNPYLLAQALLQNAWTHLVRRQNEESTKYRLGVMHLAKEHHFHLLLSQASMGDGNELIAEGQAEAGMALLLQALAEVRSYGHTLGKSHYSTYLVDGYMALGQFQKGIEVIDEALAVVDQSGEYWFDAELHRLKAELLLRQGEAADVVEGYYEKAIEIARRQHGKLWELRATVSLCKLWQAQGRSDAAYARLAAVYGWFTEGFDTPDLLEAKALLDTLV